MDSAASAPRRDFLKAALTTSIFTGNLKGANDKLTIAHIGTGTMGRGNIGYAAKAGFQIVALCDVYQPNLERGQAQARKMGQEPRLVKDFREIIADKSIDAVCISTPDHWHAYMMVEACKAGKDVYVEKPACVYVEEGLKMVEAARKYKRIVQGGTMQRSGYFFKKAVEIVKSGDLGEITFCKTWQAGLSKKDGYGFPPDEPPPADLDWDLWLGPAPKRPFNLNRWGIVEKRWSTFRYFWDYAGGAMTDWNVHLLDIVQYAFDEVMPVKSPRRPKFFVSDNTETPDTMVASYQYPKFLVHLRKPHGGAGADVRHGLRNGVPRHPGDAGGESRRLQDHPGRKVHATTFRGQREGQVHDERSALGELPRVHQVAPAAHLGDRDHGPDLAGLHPVEHRAAIRHDAGLGRQGQDRQAGSRPQVP